MTARAAPILFLLLAGPASALPHHEEQDRPRPGIRIAGRDITTPLLLSIGAFAVHRFEDAELHAELLDRSALEPGFDAGNMYGEGWVLGTTAIAAVAAGRILDDPGKLRVGTDLARSLALTWGVVWVLKPTINAARPDGGRHSFPSGHTATAFAGAPVFAAHYGPAWGAVAYSMAALTGLGRVEERRHYLADVLAGAAIGILVGREVAGGEDEDRRELRVGPNGLQVDFGF